MLIKPKKIQSKTPYTVHANSHALLDLQTTSGVVRYCEKKYRDSHEPLYRLSTLAYSLKLSSMIKVT